MTTIIITAFLACYSAGIGWAVRKGKRR